MVFFDILLQMAAAEIHSLDQDIAAFLAMKLLLFPTGKPRDEPPTFEHQSYMNANGEHVRTPRIDGQTTKALYGHSYLIYRARISK